MAVPKRPRRMLLGAVLAAASGWAGAPQGAIERAEALAAEAIRAAAARPEASLADARRALGLTAEFEPTVFVRAGRKGEVVEDEFLAARGAYRRHRAPLYEAVGECLVRSSRLPEGARYLRRAVELDPSPGRRLRLARALVALGRGREALATLLSPQNLPLPAEAVAVAEQAADAAGLPSLQVEIDRVRLASQALDPRPELRPGPVVLPERARLSSGAPVRIEGGVTVLYAAESSCRTCSADLEQIHRQAPATARVLVMAASAERDQELRQAMRLYRYDWPVVVGAGTPESLGLKPPAVLLVARDGLSGVTVPAPFGSTLGAVLSILSSEDVKESRPRPQSRQRAPEPGVAPRPGLLAEGIAPGEDVPEPKEFGEAVAAFRAGHPGEALRLFGILEARGDGWLLPPEARMNRAVCLAAQGRREEARALILAIGDSRFQSDVDRILEGIGSPRKGS
jgi:tetratricopeptide (TPR) repeat protein